MATFWTSVVFVAEMASPLATVTAMATNSTPLVSVAGLVWLMRTADGICDDVDPCVGSLDACGVCNGPGETYECGCSDIPEGDCDCDGNQLDECGICGGDGIPVDALCGGPCEADADMDGICDDVDPCVGELDACGVCNGPGEIYECGCADIPEGDCDCDGPTSLTSDGGSAAAMASLPGTAIATATNLTLSAIVVGDVRPMKTMMAFATLRFKAVQVNWRATTTHRQRLTMVLAQSNDECGICGGDGIPAGDCDCNGNQLDALGECGGPCDADADADGICDDVDPCVGELDACGVCNGPGATYECGCSDIPEGDCDCDGNVLDECGICGGDGIPAGDCDCDGNLDAFVVEMPSENATEVLVKPMQTPTASATTSTHVLESSTLAVCATDRASSDLRVRCGNGHP